MYFLLNFLRKPIVVTVLTKYNYIYLSSSFHSSSDLKADGVHTCYYITVLSYCNSVGIRKGANCAPLLADIFLYTIETEIYSETCTLKKQSLVVASNRN